MAFPRPAGSQILAATVDQCTMVAVTGAATFRLAPAFKQATQAARLAGSALIVVDMAGCTALDSTFMGTLAALGFAASKPDGTPVVLINLSANSAGLLKGLGVDRILKAYPAGACRRAWATCRASSTTCSRWSPPRARRTKWPP
jgi:anti-sigma B factor antagonist